MTALVDEVGDYEMSMEEERVNMKMEDQIFRYPELQSYFEYGADVDGWKYIEVTQRNEVVHKDVIMPSFRSWSRDQFVC